MGKASRDKEERRALTRRVADMERAASRNQPAAVSSQHYVSSTSVFQGPLPPPEILAGYERALPGAADRIVTMAEKNQAHRHALEAKVIPAGIASERIAQVLAFVLYLATIGSGTYLVGTGRDVAGITEMLASTAVFAAIYIKGQIEKKRELRGKRPD